MKTEDRILSAAGELFYRNGVKSITMDDIASNLGISKKTIYQFYPDKDSIVIALADLEINFQKKQMMEMREVTTNAVDEIFRVMTCITGTFSRITNNFIYDVQKYYPQAWMKLNEFKEKSMISFVEENLRNGISQGLYRSDINVRLLAKFRVETTSMAFNPMIFPPDKYAMKDVQLALLDHFVHGITTIKGHKLINKYKQLTEEE